jgi:ArsR family transcriptional regulator
LKEAGMEDSLAMQSEMYKSFANPHRLMIISLLKEKELNATQLTDRVKISKANLSQHMSLLTSSGIVKARKEGNNVYYSLSGKLVLQACNIMEELMMETVKREHDKIKRAF